LLQAGAGIGLREISFAAIGSLRLEKSIGIWNVEFPHGYAPAMTGLDRRVAEKPRFIGREAFLSDPPPLRRPVILWVDAEAADAAGFEPFWQNGAKVGFTTSGRYGHRVGQNLALAQVRADLAVPGSVLTVHAGGRERGGVKHSRCEAGDLNGQRTLGCHAGAGHRHGPCGGLSFGYEKFILDLKPCKPLPISPHPLPATASRSDLRPSTPDG
jgi:glycine cleavage system aminomethyltransferase T